MPEGYDINIGKKAWTAISLFIIAGTVGANYLASKYSLISEDFNILGKIAAYTGVSITAGFVSFSVAFLGALKTNNLIGKLKNRDRDLTKSL